MERTEAEQKVFKIPELVEKIFFSLDPRSVLHFVQSKLVNKEVVGGREEPLL